MSRLPWRKQKTLAMLANKRQWEREFDPIESSAIELLSEDGASYIRTETSTASLPIYYRTE